MRIDNINKQHFGSITPIIGSEESLGEFKRLVNGKINYRKEAYVFQEATEIYMKNPALLDFSKLKGRLRKKTIKKALDEGKEIWLLISGKFYKSWIKEAKNAYQTCDKPAKNINKAPIILGETFKKALKKIVRRINARR